MDIILFLINFWWTQTFKKRKNSFMYILLCGHEKVNGIVVLNIPTLVYALVWSIALLGFWTIWILFWLFELILVIFILFYLAGHFSYSLYLDQTVCILYKVRTGWRRWSVLLWFLFMHFTERALRMILPCMSWFLWPNEIIHVHGFFQIGFSHVLTSFLHCGSLAQPSRLVLVSHFFCQTLLVCVFWSNLPWASSIVLLSS